MYFFLNKRKYIHFQKPFSIFFSLWNTKEFFKKNISVVLPYSSKKMQKKYKGKDLQFFLKVRLSSFIWWITDKIITFKKKTTINIIMNAFIAWPRDQQTKQIMHISKRKILEKFSCLFLLRAEKMTIFNGRFRQTDINIHI